MGAKWKHGDGLIDRQCVVCGRDFKAKRYRLKRNPCLCCSAECARRSKRGRVFDTSPLYRALPADELAADYRSGLSTTAIAAKHGVSDVLIAKKLRQAGVTLRPAGFGRWRLAKDGHKVQSGWEMMVDDWLWERFIEHEVQPLLPFGSNQRADFKVGSYYVEVWGVVNNRRYAERRRCKVEQYREHGLRLIELWPHDLDDGSFAPLRLLGARGVQF